LYYGPELYILPNDTNANKEKNPDNVKRVMRLLENGTKFDSIFAMKNRLHMYTFDSFIMAVARYPEFCNIDQINDTPDLDAICIKELATFFAHIKQETFTTKTTMDAATKISTTETSFLSSSFEGTCKENPADYISANKECNSTDHPEGHWWPCDESTKIDENNVLETVYCGRGVMNIKGNYSYGGFGLATTGNTKEILGNPSEVGYKGDFAFLSGMWKYMTPASPRPSMHEVVIGRW